MVFARASASCWPTRRCDHCRMCWDDLWVKHDLFFWGWKSSQFGHEIRHCIRQMVRFAETSGFGANNSQATRKKSPNHLKAWDPHGAATVGRWKLRWVARGPGTWPELGPGEAWQPDNLDGSISVLDIAAARNGFTSQFSLIVEALHFTILLPISQRHLMLETLSIPSCIERAMTFSGLGSGGSFLCWASMLMGAMHCPRTWQLLTEDGPRTTSYFCRGSPTHCSLHLWIYRLLHVKMPDSKSRQIPYLAKVGQG